MIFIQNNNRITLIQKNTICSLPSAHAPIYPPYPFHTSQFISKKKNALKRCSCQTKVHIKTWINFEDIFRFAFRRRALPSGAPVERRRPGQGGPQRAHRHPALARQRPAPPRRALARRAAPRPAPAAGGRLPAGPRPPEGQEQQQWVSAFSPVSVTCHLG